MFYIGSSFEPKYRLSRHLESGNKSNDNLQEAINKYGLEYFNLYIFEVLKVNPKDSKKIRTLRLRALEQTYIEQFPKALLFNSKASSITTKVA